MLRAGTLFPFLPTLDLDFSGPYLRPHFTGFPLSLLVSSPSVPVDLLLPSLRLISGFMGFYAFEGSVTLRLGKRSVSPFLFREHKDHTK